LQWKKRNIEDLREQSGIFRCASVNYVTSVSRGVMEVNREKTTLFLAIKGKKSWGTNGHPLDGA